MRLSIPFIAVLVTALWLGIPGIEASEICIKCTAPAQTYRCTLAGEDAPADLRLRGFHCASRIAADEDHGTCAVVRKQRQCPGEPRQYVYDSNAPAPPALIPPADGGDIGKAATRKKNGDGPPDTVVELSRETARQTGESLEEAAKDTAETTRGVGEQVGDAVRNAAGAVGRAARDTVTCVGSWFNEC
ncbi:MAG: hypothetical protein ACLFPA_07495 [Dichotomicrobium sp.]